MKHIKAIYAAIIAVGTGLFVFIAGTRLVTYTYNNSIEILGSELVTSTILIIVTLHWSAWIMYKLLPRKQ